MNRRHEAALRSFETEGRNYTPAEYSSWLDETGFIDTRTVWLDAAGANGAVTAPRALVGVLLRQWVASLEAASADGELAVSSWSGQVRESGVSRSIERLGCMACQTVR